MKTLLIIAAVLVLLAFALMVVPGFRFSIVLCFAFAALCVLMYYLKKFPTPFSTGLYRAICILLILGFLAAAVTAVFILRAAHPKAVSGCDYMVVLGAGVNGSIPSLTLSDRIHAAYNYLSDHPQTIAVLSGGQGPGEEITEAACMYRELVQMGIDARRLILEENATSTMENLQFSVDLLESLTGSRPTQIAIVSSEYHLFRAGLFAKELGLEAVGVPAKTAWFSLQLNYYAREIVAVWKYLILGS